MASIMDTFEVLWCCAPLHMKCPKHQGYKGDPGVTPETGGTIGEMAQVILVWMRAPSVGNTSYPFRLGVPPVSHELCIAYDVRILECSRTPQSEVWAWKYGILSGALPWDITLEHQWHGSGFRDCQSFNMHNFLDFCLNGASEVSIGIYGKSKCCWSARGVHLSLKPRHHVCSPHALKTPYIQVFICEMK